MGFELSNRQKQIRLAAPDFAEGNIVMIYTITLSSILGTYSMHTSFHSKGR